MKFKIDFDIPKTTLKEVWPSFFMVGSCFAEEQGKRMRHLGFSCSSNPFGVIYNPVSIERLISRAVNENPYAITDFLKHHSYFCLEHHGDYAYPNSEEAVSKSNKLLMAMNSTLKSCDVVILTFGSSIVFEREGAVVANCHRLPQADFTKRQLSFDETKSSIKSSIGYIHKINPSAQIILTVSPIRHLRSGVQANSRSKAILRSSVGEIVSEFQGVSYFPSYEIFIDELRDYRFATTDLAHPTVQAEDYIWQRFVDSHFSNETASILQEVQHYVTFASHRPKDVELHSTQTQNKKKALLESYPYLQL